ncbi:ATP-binding cassette subfamily C member 4-like isoform X2 [Aethina tumida]|uniref:ATP-binding cassette subfamily C member 4-like isoform X2 n=1 Tax=Aethina tumida TaxID=116153 RepID=UPI0021471EAD|nr:ATP-binding cassette subfamily C member 4-like isoform X2 [Aethina tumida]
MCNEIIKRSNYKGRIYHILYGNFYKPFFIGLYVRYFLQTDDTPDPNSPTYLMRIVYYWGEQGPIQRDEAILFAFGLFFSNLCCVVITHPYYMYTLEMGMKLRVAACSLIYRKALRLSLTAMGKSANAINLMSNDVMRFDMFFMFLHYIWVGPLQVFFIVVFAYMEVGVAAFVGFSMLVVIVPLQSIFGRLLALLRFKIAAKTDARVKQMNEIIQSISVIKMYAWEFAFADLIHKLRKREIRSLCKTSVIRGLLMSFIMFTARTATFLTALGYVLMGNKIRADQVFIITTYYQLLRQTITVNFPNGLSALAEALVSLERIRVYILSEESQMGDPSVLDPEMVNYPRIRKPFHAIVHPEVVIDSGYAKYGDLICLEDINVVMKPGITAIVGPVGSGKTCILNLILGELLLYAGTLKIKGKVSYASQEPWLFAGTVRQNIVFGRKFDKIKYYQVVKACSLLRDFQLFPFGDQTIIGERGVSLSGGQRARVNLARSIYTDADIYLLDDPLSAVDTQVGKALVEDCFLGYLYGKVVVLVTHQLQYLEYAQNIIIMNEGEMEGQGTIEMLKYSGIEYTELMDQPVDQTGEDDNEIPELTLKVNNESSLKLRNVSTKSVDQLQGLLQKSLHTMESGYGISGKERGFKESRAEQEVAEMRSKGKISCGMYMKYFTAGANVPAVLLMFFMFLLAQAFGSGGDWFLSQWILVEEYIHQVTNDPKPLLGDYSSSEVINMYSVIIGLTFVVVIFRAMWFVGICMRASIRLHDLMFKSIVHSNMQFFYTNTSGRILNRFSKDMGCVDEFLPTALIDTFQINLNLVGAVIVLFFIDWTTIFPTIVLCCIFGSIRWAYLKTSTDIKRLEGTSRSPVFGHLNASLQGLATIRSTNSEKLLVEEFDALQDTHSSVWFMFLYTSRSFGMWLDVICTFYIGFITFSFVGWSRAEGSIVGLALTQCIGLSGLIQWGMRQSAELENQMTSVERVFEYIDIETEPSLTSTPSARPDPKWPQQGEIVYDNVSMSYKVGGHNVLSNLTLMVKPRQKIGIVGRTGAGKSSLISTLFRTVVYEGTLLIDNVDIKRIGLHDLRKKISIIPQEPVIFSGTLRYNLDPFKEYNDESIYNALVTVENKAALIKGIDCLKDIMSEGGTNLSVGQRQLVCLARAILRKNKILIMDEVTANVDPQTDKFIQQTIRTKFHYCTVLTIAHRLHTIIDYDRVLVLDAGHLIEYDHPYILLQRDGLFATMVKKTGPIMTDNLKKLAEQNYKLKQLKHSAADDDETVEKIKELKFQDDRSEYSDDEPE